MSSYDRILKENILALLNPLAEKLLGLKIVRSEPVEADKLQTTIEREPDFLRKITDSYGNIFVLHLEFQTTDVEMMYRMAEYKAIVQRQLKLPVQQYVIYFGEGKAKMRTELPPEKQIVGFKLRNIQELQANQLLQSDVPEEILLAILADHSAARVEEVVQQIILNLQRIVDDKAAIRRYLQQLLALSRMRKLDFSTQKVVENMPISYDITQDVLFKEGEAKGEAKGQVKGKEAEARMFIINMLKAGRYSVEEIAELSQRSIEYVQQLQQELGLQ